MPLVMDIRNYKVTNFRSSRCQKVYLKLLTAWEYRAEYDIPGSTEELENARKQFKLPELMITWENTYSLTQRHDLRDDINELLGGIVLVLSLLP